MSQNSFGAKGTLGVGGHEYEIFRLTALGQRFDVTRLPYSLKLLLENLLRHEGSGTVSADDVEALASWSATATPSREIAFAPARVLMQDFTGVPAIVDLAAMREAMAAMGGPAAAINPLVPVELVIDHSVQVDAFGTRDAFRINADREFERNRERYSFLRWAQGGFGNLAVVPPDTGICHQVNLEYLARVVFGAEETRDESTLPQAYPDTLVGTDSHTTMVNGLGVLGWGVGGIEAEAAMLGQPISMLIPQVLGFRLHGKLRTGATATDLVLTVTERLRQRGVVGMFVEFFGAGLAGLPITDRATIGNMSPEFGSTCAIFPIDAETVRYLQFTGRPQERIELVEAYAREQGLWHDHDSPEPVYSDVIELDLGEVVPSLAGPKRPQDRVSLDEARVAFRRALTDYVDGIDPQMNGHDEAEAESYPASDPPADGAPGHQPPALIHGGSAPSGEPTRQPSGGAVTKSATTVTVGDETFELAHGDVVIAAITSCTNTSNPSVMIGAGLLARKAVQYGLHSKPWVKTSLAPGSRVVSEYLDRAGLTEPLERLGFNLVGYGCTTCIGNSGPLAPEISAAVADGDLAVVSVLSGNRNFEGRINPDVKMNYLASPPLCVAYALAGTMDIDLATQPLGTGDDGQEVYLRDIWPGEQEVAEAIGSAIASDMFRSSYAQVFSGDERWKALAPAHDAPAAGDAGRPAGPGEPDGAAGPGGAAGHAGAEGARFAWDDSSTYVRQPPFFDGMPDTPGVVTDVQDARVLAVLGDSVTTDHISPAGSIKRDSPAGAYLLAEGIAAQDFNSYGSRRGNHEVMMRGTFANIRLRNLIGGGEPLGEGGVTRYFADGASEPMPIYDAAMRYIAAGTPLVVLAGREYGSGSSRDWAAKGTSLLGVKAVIAESFERIHRSNLVGMGVLPLQFADGNSAASIGLTGEEVISITGLADAMADGGAPPATVRVQALAPQGGTAATFDCVVRIDTPREAEYFRHGGILQYVIRQLLAR